MRVLLSKVLLEDKWYRWFLFSLVLAGGISFLLMFYLFWVGAFEGLLPPGIVIPGRDFRAQYNVAILFSQGEDIWATSNHYFPLLVFYHLLFSHLSFYPAFLAITLWNLLLALTASVLATKILGYYHVSLPAGGKWLIFLAIIFFCPVTASLNSGNVNTLVFCFITMFYYFLCVRDKSLYAGLSLVVATVFKIFPAALLLFAAIKRKFKSILAFLLILILICAVSVLLLGVPAHIYFAEFVAGYQSGQAMGSNSAISGIIWNSLEFFNINGLVQDVAQVSWIFVRLAFILLILGYLLWLSRTTGEDFRDKEWSILLFSLFSVLMVSHTTQGWMKRVAIFL